MSIERSYPLPSWYFSSSMDCADLHYISNSPVSRPCPSRKVCSATATLFRRHRWDSDYGWITRFTLRRPQNRTAGGRRRHSSFFCTHFGAPYALRLLVQRPWKMSRFIERRQEGRADFWTFRNISPGENGELCSGTGRSS